MSCSIDGKDECQKLIEVSIIIEDNNNFLIWRFRTGFLGSYTSTILQSNNLYLDLYFYKYNNILWLHNTEKVFPSSRNICNADYSTKYSVFFDRSNEKPGICSFSSEDVVQKIEDIFSATWKAWTARMLYFCSLSFKKLHHHNLEFNMLMKLCY